MKETLSDEEISHPLNEALLREAEEIRTERKVLKERLQLLEESRASVSDAVYQKVRTDYSGKLNRTTERLVALKKDLEIEERQLLEKKLTVENHLKLHKEKIEESTLRHTLGEYPEAQHQEIVKREEREIHRLEESTKELQEGLERHRLIFEGEELHLPKVEMPSLSKISPAPSPAVKPSPMIAEITPSPIPEPMPPPAPARATTPPVTASPLPTVEPVEQEPPAPPPVPRREPPPPRVATQASSPSPVEVTARIQVDEKGIPAATPPPEKMPPAPPMGSRKVGELTVFEGGKMIQTVPLDHTVMIGRSPANDVVLKEPKVSRRHAQIQYVNGKYVLMDLESSNGTYVGGKKVTEYVLQPNDEITIGQAKMVFKG